MKRKTTHDKSSDPSAGTRWRLQASRESTVHAGGLKGDAPGLTVPSCTETVQEDFSDEELGPEWTGQLFTGDGSNGLGDAQDFTDPSLWDDSFSRGDWIAEAFPETQLTSTTEATEPAPEPVAQAEVTVGPEPRPAPTVSERLRAALQEGLNDQLSGRSFAELRDDQLDWPALLRTAGGQTRPKSCKYLKTANRLKGLNDPGLQDLVVAFTLLFLAGGQARGRSLLKVELENLISRTDIEALDSSSRDYLALKWTGQRRGVERTLVMGPGKASAARSGTVHPVLERLWQLVEQGVVLNDEVAQDIEDSPTLPELQLRLRQRNQKACNGVVATAANLYQAERTDDAQCVALLALLIGFKPRARPLKKLKFGDLISRVFVEGLGVKFCPPLSLDGI